MNTDKKNSSADYADYTDYMFLSYWQAQGVLRLMLEAARSFLLFALSFEHSALKGCCPIPNTRCPIPNVRYSQFKI
jgi:hypothetical protein